MMATITARAAIPALMWIAVPPAKSRAPRLKSQPAGPNTQWATGEYTSIDQNGDERGVATELQPVRRRARDQRRGDDGEHHLEGEE